MGLYELIKWNSEDRKTGQKHAKMTKREEFLFILLALLQAECLISIFN